MRKIAFIVCIVLMFSACNNTKSNKAENETNNVRKTEQKEVSASLKEVTLSFKDIESVRISIKLIVLALRMMERLR